MSDKVQVRIGLVLLILLWCVGSAILLPLVMPLEAASALSFIGGMGIGAFVVLGWIRT